MRKRAQAVRQRRRAFDDLPDDPEPCPVCLALARNGDIQPRAVMPLPKVPARLRLDGSPCCRDCQATETTMALVRGQHPMFVAARLTVSNERCAGLVMPPGLMESFGLCAVGYVEPCSLDDLEAHIQWLERHGIPNSSTSLPVSEWSTQASQPPESVDISKYGES